MIKFIQIGNPYFAVVGGKTERVRQYIPESVFNLKKSHDPEDYDSRGFSFFVGNTRIKLNVVTGRVEYLHDKIISVELVELHVNDGVRSKFRDENGKIHEIIVDNICPENGSGAKYLLNREVNGERRLPAGYVDLTTKKGHLTML